ncbi:MAG: xanthine dehydrogenase family protein subunit M [Deltaproteobacteria bacterium]|nr:xanthine dehydrogenase family protein subunit M [Deltaproteobacteria bacterium]
MGFDLLEPRTVAEAVELHARDGNAVFLAGGTALLILQRQGLPLPRRLISLRGIPGLDEITAGPGGGLRIGALATLRQVERHPLVVRRVPLLAEALRQVANVRVRHTATLGGNLAHGDYRLDPPAPLLVLGAQVRAVGIGGEREIALAAFFRGLFETALQPGEVVTELAIPPTPPSGTAYLKYALSSNDWPCVGAAALVALDDHGRCREVRLALTAVAAAPVLVRGLDELARGEPVSDRLAARLADIAAAQVEPVGDQRGSEWYKREMARVFARRALLAAARRAEAGPVGDGTKEPVA